MYKDWGWVDMDDFGRGVDGMDCVGAEQIEIFRLASL